MLSASQISEWVAYAELEPFGSTHESSLWGQLCATVANFSQLVVKDGNKRKMFVPSDFVPDFLKEPVEVVEKKKGQTIEEMKTVLLGFAGTSNRKRGKRK